MAWKHYVALGDSLTEGIGDPVPGIESISWADRLARMLTPKQYTNLARRGQTSDDLIATQLPAALRLRPDLVSLLIGGNDIATPDWNIEDFRSNYRAIIGALKGMGATVITMTMVDILPAIPMTHRSQINGLLLRVRAVNEAIREISQQYNTVFIDLESVIGLQDFSTLSRDMIHPNMLGYEMIAEEVIRYFSEWEMLIAS